MTKSRYQKEKELLLYESKKARNEFVKEIANQPWNVQLRVTAENILIMYDQLIQFIKAD